MFNRLRRIIIFVLGALIILDALRDKANVIPKLIIGMILVGILPIDDLFAWWNKQRIDHHSKCEIESKREAPE